MIPEKSLYVHLPFCERKCFYCSFVVVIAQEERADRYLSCLNREAQRYEGEAISTIYMGGGTPTYLDARQLDRLCGDLLNNFEIDRTGEWTIEANPENLEIDKLKLLKERGINRVSLGIQTFHDGFLKFLGRNHDSGSALRAYESVRRAGFTNVSIDLMFGLPQQTMDDLTNDLNLLKSLDPEHVSLYALTIEEPSRFFVQKLQLPDDNHAAQQYQLIIESLSQKGLHQYEVSNFAKDGYKSAHNVNYWQGGNYIGLGVGAHSHNCGHRSWNVGRLDDYIDRVQEGRSTQLNAETLSPHQQAIERFLFGLRMNEGVSVTAIPFLSFNDEQERRLDGYVRDGFLIKDADRFRVSDKGRLVLDELSIQLI